MSMKLHSKLGDFLRILSRQCVYVKLMISQQQWSGMTI